MKWAVITGASAGIGWEFAKICADEGYSLVLIARRRDRLLELTAEIKKKHPKTRIEVLDMDLSNFHSAREIHKKVSEWTPQIHLLINNAGFGAGGPFPEPALSRQLEMIDLNCRSLVELTGVFLPEMKKAKQGHILNVGSTAGFQPGPFMSIYYASKAFVNSFSEALHEELQGTGVTCTVLAPGPVSTEFGQVAKMNSSRLFKASKGLSAYEVAKAGYRGAIEGCAIVIPGLAPKLIPQLARLMPRAIARKTAGWLNRTRPVQ